MWTYAWDLLDLGFDTVPGELSDRAGVNGISLATSYHAGRFPEPRSPKRKVYFPEDGTIYPSDRAAGCAGRPRFPFHVPAFLSALISALRASWAAFLAGSASRAALQARL
jgi:hypothetical protein